MSTIHVELDPAVLARLDRLERCVVALGRHHERHLWTAEEARWVEDMREEIAAAESTPIPAPRDAPSPSVAVDLGASPEELAPETPATLLALCDHLEGCLAAAGGPHALPWRVRSGYEDCDPGTYVTGPGGRVMLANGDDWTDVAPARVDGMDVEGTTRRRECSGACEMPGPEDAALIVAAVNALPRLIAAAREGAGTVQRIAAMLDREVSAYRLGRDALLKAGAGRDAADLGGRAVAFERAAAWVRNGRWKETP